MPRQVLRLLAACSFSVAVVLFCGYFSRFGPSIYYPSSPRQTLFLEVVEEEGRIAIWFERLNSGAPHSTKLSIHWSGPDLRAPKPDRSFWEFDAHWLAGNTARATFLFAFPIWCLLLPFLILPVVWLRQRRNVTTRGFPVVERDASAPSPSPFNSA
jgi:hypothetical protein